MRTPLMPSCCTGVEDGVNPTVLEVCGRGWRAGLTWAAGTARYIAHFPVNLTQHMWHVFSQAANTDTSMTIQPARVEDIINALVVTLHLAGSLHRKKTYAVSVLSLLRVCVCDVTVAVATSWMHTLEAHGVIVHQKALQGDERKQLGSVVAGIKPDSKVWHILVDEPDMLSFKAAGSNMVAYVRTKLQQSEYTIASSRIRIA